MEGDPHSLGRKSTVYDRFREWRRAGVFESLWKESLLDYDEMEGIDWEWQSMDSDDDESPSRGEKAQDPTPLTERNQGRRGASS